MNPRAAINDLLPFQGSPFGQLGYFSKMLDFKNRILSGYKRRGWDSNPRALSDKRFSRPPRYDHFDTSPHSDLLTAFAWRQSVFYHLYFSMSTAFLRFFWKNFTIFLQTVTSVFPTTIYRKKTNFNHNFTNASGTLRQFPDPPVW